jgi:hypothetical protein
MFSISLEFKKNVCSTHVREGKLIAKILKLIVQNQLLTLQPYIISTNTVNSVHLLIYSKTQKSDPG